MPKGTKMVVFFVEVHEIKNVSMEYSEKYPQSLQYWTNIFVYISSMTVFILSLFNISSIFTFLMGVSSVVLVRGIVSVCCKKDEEDEFTQVRF